MRLKELELAEFRSYRTLLLAIDPAGFRAVGANASGKSTLLEAIAMLATTRSPRTSSEREIANWESGTEFAVPPYARIRGKFERHDGLHQVEVGISIENEGQGPLKKSVRFDERQTRSIDAVGQFKCVLFSSDDVNLVSGPPSARRRYLDMAISQASQPYLRALSRYGRVVEQRNSLLRSFARDRVPPGSPRTDQELAFWNGEMTAAGADVLALRIGAIARLSQRSKVHFAALTGDDTLRISYNAHRVRVPELDRGGTYWRAPTQTQRQSLAAALSTALADCRLEEHRRGVTAIGPHRDDFGFEMGATDLGRFGSRGQQRLAMIALKLAELDLLTEAAGEPPVLLLDDVLSELDIRHRSAVIANLASRETQICVTAVDERDFATKELDRLPMLRIRSGVVHAVPIQ